MIAMCFVTPNLSWGLMKSNKFLALATSLSAKFYVDVILITMVLNTFSKCTTGYF
jgi:hypothetical protein